MEYEKRKIILPQFESFKELLEYVEDDVAVHLYQGGEWDKINDNGKERLTLKNPLTLEQFMGSVGHHFPNGFRIGDKYVTKYGTKID